MANRGRLASEVDPTESALQQVAGGMRMARHLGGPVTKDFVINTMAATQGMSQDQAAAIFGSLDPQVQAARQQGIIDQQVQAAQNNAPQTGGYDVFRGANTIPAAIQGAAQSVYEGSLGGLVGSIPYVGGPLRTLMGSTTALTGGLSPAESMLNATPQGIIEKLGIMGGWTAGRAGAALGGVRAHFLGRPSARPFIPGSLYDEVFKGDKNSANIGAQVSFGKQTITASMINEQDEAVNTAIDAIAKSADPSTLGAGVYEPTRALFTASLGEIVAAQGMTGDDREAAVEALRIKASDTLSDPAQAGIFNKMLGSAMAGEHTGVLKRGVMFQARREASMAGFRFLAMRTQGGSAAIGELAGTPAATSRGGLAKVLQGQLAEPTAQGNALDAMRADHHRLLGKMGDGKSVSIDILKNDYEAFMISDFKRFDINEDGSLSKDELQKLETSTLEQFAATKGQMRGAALGGPGGGSQMAVLNRLIRVMDQTNTLLADLNTSRSGTKPKVPVVGGPDS
jgi:hypothetical protein